MNGAEICTMKPSTDYICDLNCPARMSADKPVYCCQNCWDARKYYVTEANKHLWTDEVGFHSANGCKLPREQMPSECREYDCRRYFFLVTRYWRNGEWIDLKAEEVICSADEDRIKDNIVKCLLQKS